MKIHMPMTALLTVFAVLFFSAQGSTQEKEMTAIGSFEIDLTPQNDAEYPVGRMLIKKTYAGALVGSGVGQMISKRTEGGTAIYHAIEEFSGALDGKRGGFTLIHFGHMTAESQSLEVAILEGSGSGELKNLSGSMSITQDAQGHSYELNYDLGAN